MGLLLVGEHLEVGLSQGFALEVEPDGEGIEEHPRSSIGIAQRLFKENALYTNTALKSLSRYSRP